MISVVVSSYNRSHSLETALESLRETNVPDGLQWEILVVDNNSTDDTRGMVAAFAARSAVNVRYVLETTQGLSHARNRGVREAAGEIIAFIDDDVRVRTDWLVRLRDAFNTYDADCIGGRALLDPMLPRPAWWRPEFDGYIGHFDRGAAAIVSHSPLDGKIGIGANLAFRRRAFDRAGLFRTDLGRSGNRLLMGEEVELVDRVRRAGGTGVYYPAAVVEHCPDAGRLTREYLRRWYSYYGEWDFAREQAAPMDAIRILGVPRWRFRSAGRQAVSLVKAAVTGNSGDAFGSELRLRAFGGYLRAARRRAFR